MTKLRLALAAAAVVLLGLFGFAGTASAEGDISHAAHLCIEQLEAGKDIDSCQKAPNPLLPETHEIIWGTFGFAVVLFGMWKFALPAMKTTLDARAERIKGDLDAAEAQKAEAEGILSEYRTQLADARNESARIIEEARQSADEMKRELQARAESDIAELRTRAAADIEAAKTQAISDLRGEVTALAIGAAEQVVERNLDRDTNVALIESYINQVGANS
ncbi:MAG: F0F1 ATP synthase subunit B [Acidimicrobiales bacterium]|nr:F0F1 ATP synthase subunit B [Acidimicrobiales bacterium]